MTSAIIVAAGRGRRIGKEKQWIELAGKSVILHSLEKFESLASVDEIVFVVPKARMDYAKTLARRLKKVRKIIPGGERRMDSVYEGVKVSKGDIVVIHDGARPFVDKEVIEKGIDLCKEYDAVITSVPATDTVKYVEDNFVHHTIPREKVWLAHTPQFFKRKLLIEAYERFHSFDATDESSLVEKCGVRVKVLKDSYENIKLTTEKDMAFAEAILIEYGQDKG